ncbi:MAG: MerR family transcriptional regulator [Ardenticatenaceae bacterium]|nr:MerR family transcriptional regulator [Anaerolineales bacterium]MCB8921939.1 MerR family transcriptional regulator [Ardenticatenaceae bacterium]MCB8989514.1 MerR family transcriptional regulator [Ardenticatenaceae bacterium]MCB9003058.1 MerR family transcriptional regulator [Ardenticatenaceae bacterium]
MFKIGEFSKLSRVPVKTLRYYHQIGLLEPAHIDDFTGYRYYTAVQLTHLNHILVLKDLGFSLEQISLLLDDDLSPPQIRGMLRLKRLELAQQIAEEQARLVRLDEQLTQFEKGANMPAYEVIIKQVGNMHIAGLRDVIANYQSIGPLYDTLFATLKQHNISPIGPAMGIYYDEEYKESDVEVEAAIPVTRGSLPAGRVVIRELPGAEVASLVRQGPYDESAPAYQAIMSWIEANGYHIIGPNRELYLRGTEAGIPPAEFVTEIQFPVAKIT